MSLSLSLSLFFKTNFNTLSLSDSVIGPLNWSFNFIFINIWLFFYFLNLALS